MFFNIPRKQTSCLTNQYTHHWQNTLLFITSSLQKETVSDEITSIMVLGTTHCISAQALLVAAFYLIQNSVSAPGVYKLSDWCFIGHRITDTLSFRVGFPYKIYDWEHNSHLQSFPSPRKHITHLTKFHKAQIWAVIQTVVTNTWAMTSAGNYRHGFHASFIETKLL